MIFTPRCPHDFNDFIDENDSLHFARIYTSIGTPLKLKCLRN